MCRRSSEENHRTPDKGASQACSTLEEMPGFTGEAVSKMRNQVKTIFTI